MKRNTMKSAVRTADGKQFFAPNDALLNLYLSQAGNPKVVAVQMPSGAWSTNPNVVSWYN